ncbi:type II toxin-antitoxin system HipA family toxin [Myroides marinus]|uniref:type II toxin-antitoxin system HipA family toxin n=1 Tax=Myroides marinus TaxID=703342 RepID=UPI002578B616|nr:type II toxin-antitoxin system HipA family toxin [Myroides marinus]MDM1368253.1 type II toxin-antitoxin system HipA family toxin [Myroides marinus]MDM1378581.1 type II toxin-antitoxin system HipA family toxin [Myroides marinus]MDM1385852.1 type II toxin-antitoxin system HipA family toxin [Myroides marinus]MDM1393065.1 type II toxin-antitoxin system HipA family toxin [Myroides marinus]
MKLAVKEIKVGLNFGFGIQPVGRLAIRNSIIYFEYDEAFLLNNLEISPIKLPLQGGVIQLPKSPFEGLAGVFNDSLPDGWGRLLFDRLLRSKGISASDISPLDRLAYVGLNGLGALVFEPDQSLITNDEIIDLDVLATQTKEVLEGESEEVIRELLALNGSSAGARPKALIGVDSERKSIIHGTDQLSDDFEHWMVKFPNSQDGIDAGAIEYIYALMALDAGIEMPAIHLFASQKGSGYFGVKRFDRNGNKSLHMHTVSGLIHNNFRFPSLDYEDLLSLTGVLTKDIREVEKMFRLAVFNVMAHNRDDHSKNFTFLMNEFGQWKLSPAYDLTFSSGPGGEQSTMVMGEGRNISIKHLTKLGLEAKLSKEFVGNVIEQTRSALDKWMSLSKDFGVSKSNIGLIQKAISQL